MVTRVFIAEGLLIFLRVVLSWVVHLNQTKITKVHPCNKELMTQQWEYICQGAHLLERAKG